MSQELLETLGVDPNRMEEFAASVVHNSFFDKLAEYNIVPQTPEEAAKLIESANRLEQIQRKTAAYANQSRIDRVYNLLAGGDKQAASPVVAQQRLEVEVMDKTAAYLQNPECFAYAIGLRALTREAQAAG